MSDPAPTLPNGEPDEELRKMSFGDHLDELRSRLTKSLIVIAVCVFAMLPFKSKVSAVYIEPYRIMWREAFIAHCEKVEAEAEAAGEENLHKLLRARLAFLREHKQDIVDGTFPEDMAQQIQTEGGFKTSYNLIATGGLQDMWVFIAASFLFALMISAPFVLYQVWAFLAAGLYQKERAVVMRYMPWAVLLLSCGVAFGYFIVVPTAFYFLVQLMDQSNTQFLPTVSEYFSMLFTLTAALGFVFQLPLIMLAVTKIGLVTHKGWRQNWRYVILGFFVVSALLTPPDPVTQIMMAAPLAVLYAIGLVVTSRANTALEDTITGDGDGAAPA